MDGGMIAFLLLFGLITFFIGMGVGGVLVRRGMEKLAVCYGKAKFVPDEDGNPTFKWDD